MQDSHSSEQHVDECADLEASTLFKDHLHLEEDQRKSAHPAKPKVTITYHAVKTLRRPTCDKGWDAASSDSGASASSDSGGSSPESSDCDTLTSLISRWLHLWSRLCLLGVLQCPHSGWGRLPWFLLRAVLAVTLLAQAVTTVGTLLALPKGAAFFVSLQACQHFSLLSLLLPALSARAAAFRRALALMARLQALRVFADLNPVRPRARLLVVMTVACLVFLGLQVLHVVGGVINVEFQHSQGIPAMRFALFPPVVRSDNFIVHYGMVLLQVRCVIFIICNC